MTKWILIASVAALAISAPAQAERGGNHGGQNPDQEQQAQAKAAARGGGRQQQQAPQQQARQPAQQARQFQQRPQPQQQMQVYQQRARPQQQVQQRPQQQMPVFQQRARAQQQMPVYQQRARPERQMQVVQQRVQRTRPERQVQLAQPRVQRVRPVENRAAGRQLVQQRARIDNRARLQDRVVQRQARPMTPVRQAQQQRQQQARVIQPRVQRLQPSIQSAQRTQVGDRFLQQQQRQEQRQANRFAGMQQRFDQRSARINARATQRALIDSARLSRPQAAIGQLLTTPTLTAQAVNQNWYGDYAAQRYSSYYTSAPNSYYNYNYNDGYLYQVNRNSNLVTALFPLLGGAFGAGQMLPYGYQNYNVPYGYQSLYYDTPDYSYRYGDGAIYRVDPDTQLIESVVALLSGQNFGVGQQLPMGYDVYNVPYGYRDQYYDTANNWYRYDNGMIYQVDPYSRMIENSYPVSYGGYQVGYPVPAYGGYAGYPSYSVPYAYQDLYYSAPGYNYQYSNGGIYQVDPSTQLVSALVGLVTGQNLGIGQQLPMGYDAYNVPYAYRDQYYDTADSMYRYDDGYIYGVDPQTRMIQSAYPVSYDGYAVGYPMPSYAGYAVPSAYDGLYTNTSGYDYRYANGGIYQIDPNTRMVQSIAALMTGQNFGVGQMLPNDYDAYNVPYAYRRQYYDTPDSWYRYADGNIYRVDPQTRVIQAVFNAVA